MSVYFYGCVTLDGYLANKNHSLSWLHETGNVEETTYDDFYDKMDIILMGRKTFDEIANIENASSFYPTTKNYVFTRKNDISIDGFIMLNSSVVEFVKSLPADKNTWIVGGNTLLAPLLNENMVDTLIVQIAPVLLGEGIPLFTQAERLKRFHLEKVNKYGQFAELVYQKQ